MEIFILVISVTIMMTCIFGSMWLLSGLRFKCWIGHHDPMIIRNSIFNGRCRFCRHHIVSLDSARLPIMIILYICCLIFALDITGYLEAHNVYSAM